MKLSVIALDYDGTIARNNWMGPSVRQAIADVRARGILVLLVTGRILDDLRRIAGDLHFVDGVVAENSAMLHFPETARRCSLERMVLVSLLLVIGAGLARRSSTPGLLVWRGFVGYAKFSASAGNVPRSAPPAPR